MKKITILAVMVLAATALLTSCGAKKNVAQNGYYQQQPYGYQQQPQQPQQQPSYQPQPTPAPKQVASGPEGKVKEWESKGYEITGTVGLFTMYDCLKAVYDKILPNRDKYILISGTGVHKTSADAAHNAALINAIQYYATAAGSEVKGRFEREYSTFTDLDKLISAYAGNISKKITSYVNEEIAVRRKTDNGYEYEVWFTLDETKVKLLRQQAMEQALQETAVEQTVGNAIRDYVNEAVPGNAM